MSTASVPGWVRVKVLQRQDNLVLVELPRQTFQQGAYITVTSDQLESRLECDAPTIVFTSAVEAGAAILVFAARIPATAPEPEGAGAASSKAE